MDEAMTLSAEADQVRKVVRPTARHKLHMVAYPFVASDRFITRVAPPFGKFEYPWAYRIKVLVSVARVVLKHVDNRPLCVTK